MSDSLQLHGLYSPWDYTVHGILQARIMEWEPFPSPGDLPNLGSEPRSPALQADSLLSEPPGKPKEPKGMKNTIFPKRVVRFLASLSPFLVWTNLDWVSEWVEGKSLNRVQLFATPWTGLYSPWNSPGQNPGWIAFPFSRGSSQPGDQTQVGLPRCRQILYQLSHQGTPVRLEGMRRLWSSSCEL